MGSTVKKSQKRELNNNATNEALSHIGVGYSDDDPYETNTEQVAKRWYRQLPYSFIFTPANGKNDEIEEFYLPIAPSNLNIVTHFATNVISTMYGTVEEHSEQRYFDITISGTTGIAPKYYGSVANMKLDQAGQGTLLKSGRAGFEINRQFDNNALGGFFKKSLALIENSINKINKVFDDNPSPGKTQAGVDIYKTGYVAFHNFYKMLLRYKANTAASSTRRGGHPLTFRNYKDNNQYDVSINNFQLSRDATNPMLYNYNITMRAYNLRSADETIIKFNENSLLLERTGLGKLEGSTFNKMSNKMRTGKNAAYSAVAAIKGFGS